MRNRDLWSLSALVLVITVDTVMASEEKAQGYEKNSTQGYDTASIFGMEYLPIGHVRTDPILSKQCLSDHVHTFYGPPMLHPSVTFDELRSARNTREATSGNVLENQSLYWHPSFYKRLGDGTKEIVEPEWTTIYYAFEKGMTTAFPAGFRMIATHPGGLEITCYSDNKEKSSAYDSEEKSDSDSDNSLFPSEPCAELAASFTFPNCWDGKSLGTGANDPRSHVAYGVGLEQGTLDTFGGGNFQCPESHPVLVPQIELFLRFADYAGEPYELSNGDGVDWHADYIMGWEEDFLQQILDDCDDLKDIPCGSTRLRNIERTGVAKNKDEVKVPSNSYSDMGAALRQVRVPMANTTCITEEPITDIEAIPRGSCRGSVLAAGSCAQPKLPAEFLVDDTAKESRSGSGVTGAGIALTFTAMLVAFLSTML